MYSDNGTNFVGANKELMNIQEAREMKKEDVRTITEVHTSRRNMGGAWERWCDLSNRVGRYIEREPSRRSSPLLEAEHIVNSRPLTEVDIEPAEAEGLTPNHFLIGRSGAAARPDDNVLSGLQTGTCQRLADHFWQRWLREYLPTLVPRRIKKTYPGPDNKFVWWTSRRLVAFCGVPLRRSSCWCQLERRLFRVLKCSAAHRGGMLRTAAQLI
ncbi:hypothetical protein EVAR_28018_1 [Eumeta japonica]|uniref:Uncharacterized protein n=1 Tax=Eumeta variegata TaxID=151549 RepID=A0A4C1WDT8_EUMVA|nr:hypothetical protein EVAR_28018_1 [Eumeta japonica]